MSCNHRPRQLPVLFQGERFYRRGRLSAATPLTHSHPVASPLAQVVRAEEEASMTLHYIVHTSIDVFEEKVCTPNP